MRCTVCGHESICAGESCEACGTRRETQDIRRTEDPSLASTEHTLKNGSKSPIASDQPREWEFGDMESIAPAPAEAHLEPYATSNVDEPGKFTTSSGSYAVTTRQSRPPRRGLDASTATTLVTGLPRVFLSGLIVFSAAEIAGSFFGVEGIAGQILNWGAVLLWLASAVIILLPSTQPAVARIIFRYRKPTKNELVHLKPAWSDVLKRAGIDPTQAKYSLWVQDTPELNASATGGSVVSVSGQALHLYRGPELSAILAHELGHHLGGHPWSRLTILWLSLPYFTVKRITALLFLVIVQISPLIGCLALGIFFIIFVGFAVALIKAPPVIHIVLIFAIIMIIIEPIMNRRAEYKSDDKAVELGYGPQLISVFEGWLAQGHDDHRQSASAMALYKASHPSVGSRITRAEQRMDKLAG